jgi:hypothetical protein
MTVEETPGEIRPEGALRLEWWLLFRASRLQSKQSSHCECVKWGKITAKFI